MALSGGAGLVADAGGGVEEVVRCRERNRVIPKASHSRAGPRRKNFIEISSVAIRSIHQEPIRPNALHAATMFAGF
jgi:hypothetical protein